MEHLPRGLLATATQKVSADLTAADMVELADVARLWRVYSANPSVHNDDKGYRLENLFWRIWGNRRLSRSLSGSMLADLFSRIADQRSISLSELHKAHKRASQVDKPRKPSSSSGKPLAPILKKPSSSHSSHGETHKTTRILLTGLDGQTTTRKPSNTPTPIPAPPLVVPEPAARAPQRKIVLTAKARGTKRRPVIKRRKSSQHSTGTTGSSTQDPAPLMTDYPESRPVLMRRKSSQQSETSSSVVETPPDSVDAKGLPRSKPRGSHQSSSTSDNSARVHTPQSDSVSGSKNLVESPKSMLSESLQQPESATLTVDCQTQAKPAEMKVSETVKEVAISPKGTNGGLSVESQSETATVIDRPEEPRLPEEFLEQLKELLNPVNPPRPPSPPPHKRPWGDFLVHPPTPKPNVFVPSAIRRYDYRYLEAKNYQPTTAKLVDKDFRQRFSDSVRTEHFLASTLGGSSWGVSTTRSNPMQTADTLIDSGIQGHGNTLTPGSGATVETVSDDEISGESDVEVNDGEEEDLAGQSGFSLPPRRSGISDLLDQSRRR
ncbi:GATA-like domain-containing protein [Aspergillus saccharolyticus JOP 1030-1]|uniref:Nitrogen regulatory protein areA GATA-like domain-containing protein n=1 Tax=Aspergillus saccharolyticus JOP 1030-1 TaxID=1450539 RepID=A0A318ZWN6_9EURO|nr:hypothetical protein BP01DRAFT_379131 [Aspergillus saccharolyticus JOP 1030-1]PYH48723.1 hypothetical protein BP01DRAFT_379131 [Aspergillus saccharolyticus JOP 1030-1]